MLMCVHFIAIFANLRKEFREVEAFWDNGDLDALAGALITLKPNIDEERAFVQFYNALLEKQSSQVMESLKSLGQKYPTTLYAQKGMLELAKLHILDRDIELALAQLRKISANELSEKSYWQAVCSFQNSEWQNTINHAENYLRLIQNGIYTEEAYYLISDSYIYMNKASSAISSLNKLKAIKDLPTDNQYFYYRLGYAHELTTNNKEAVAQYKEGYLLNKFSQIAYMIEDRLFGMRESFGSSIDIAFLYPYVELQLDEVSTVVNTNGQVTATPPPPPVNGNLPLKVSEKPSGDYFIQAGRFSSENNASNLAKKIRALEISAVYYEAFHNNAKTWVVVCGPFSTQQDAIFAHSKLRENEVDCFITRN